MRSTSLSIATSPTTASASPPAASIRLTVSFAAFASMSATTTLAPSAAKSCAASRPIPMPAPVMSAVFPLSRSPMWFLSPGRHDAHRHIHDAEPIAIVAVARRPAWGDVGSGRIIPRRRSCEGETPAAMARILAQLADEARCVPVKLSGHEQAAEKGPDARRRPRGASNAPEPARETYSLYVERAAEGCEDAPVGANEA